MGPFKRRDDPPEEDHSEERHPPDFDWRLMAPRWALVTTVAFLLVGVGAMYGKYTALYDDRQSLMEKYQSDARWDALAKLSEAVAIQGAQLRHHEAQLQQLTKAADDIVEIRSDVRVLKRIAEGRR